MRGPKRTFNPDPGELRKLYQKMSMRDIANALGVGETVVFKRLKEHGIVLEGHENGGHRVKKGRIKTEAHRRNHSESLKKGGKVAWDKNPRWKGNATDENQRLRRTGAYKRWKIAALELRGNKCQDCGVAHRSICESCGTQVI